MKAIKRTGPVRVWSQVEIEAMLDTYFSMLAMQLKGEAYTKAPMVRELAARINRSKGSCEAKMMNTSAVLLASGHPIVTGYKALGNAQGLLRELVAARLAAMGGAS